MDPEQTYLRVHARLSGMLSQLLTPGIRMALEFMYFTFAVAIFVLLFVMHANFVQQPGCASELSGVKFGEAQLVQIKISTAGLWTQTSSGWNSLELQSGVLRDNTGSTDIAADGFTVLSTKFWSNWFGSGSRRSKLIFKSWKNDKELLVPAVEKTSDITITKTIEHETNSKSESPILQIGRPISIREFILVEVKDFSSKLKIQFISFLKRGKEFLISASHLWKRAGWYAFLDFLECLRLLRFEDLKSLPVLFHVSVQYLEKKSRAIEPAYLYTTEKGYFLLPEVAKSHHNIQTVNITISAQSSCFGNRWQQLLINVFVGYDTILMNTLLSSPGHGYLYNYQTKEFYDLSYGQEASNGPTRFGGVWFSPDTSSFLYDWFEPNLTQSMKSLPRITFIMKPYCWIMEMRTEIVLRHQMRLFLYNHFCASFCSVRTTISMQFFPRFFLLYFLVFHIYFFSYPYGFSYVAFSAMAAFMQHLILYFWNRFEVNALARTLGAPCQNNLMVPALQRFMRTRAQLQHQTGVQITSSAIYTSTFHIARVSIPNRNPFGTEPTIATAETPARSDQASELDPPAVPFANNEAQEVPNLNPHQRTQPPPRPTNSLGSLLLSLLGGAHSESLFSLFSPSRDSQNQGQVYTEQTPQENQPLTT
ncbi:hypothetical protein ZIOFF_043059 [Zingiber officinale]|uniref:Membralin n=1 Tax=Zingiber officinale TaxID=94328 RepID=A0A8J5KYG3_ZINOF|nr:hypothetical protein ZIOFF_043059 [Zingiber officinale]